MSSIEAHTIENQALEACKIGRKCRSSEITHRRRVHHGLAEGAVTGAVAGSQVLRHIGATEQTVPRVEPFSCRQVVNKPSTLII
jgi:uncharacterized protein YcfJ